MAAYYNEIDQKAAAWLRELITEGVIADGDIDTRDIRDVPPSDLEGYTQCHFFAGIGGWAYALRLAGWPDTRPVWTGSCPCQPFSAAGKGAGIRDSRHLWPAFRWIIAKRRPATVFGEQVASKDGRGWFAGVRSDLEAMGYAAGGADLCAAGVFAPHIRQRLWWVADSVRDGAREECGELQRIAGSIAERQRRREGAQPGDNGKVCGLANRDGDGRMQEQSAEFTNGGTEEPRTIARDRVAHGGWADAIWWPCLDGKWRRVPARRLPNGASQRAGRVRDQSAEERPHHCNELSREHGGVCFSHGRYDGLEVEPALFPLADGVPGRVGLLRGAGNAIVPQVAAAFIESYMEVTV